MKPVIMEAFVQVTIAPLAHRTTPVLPERHLVLPAITMVAVPPAKEKVDGHVPEIPQAVTPLVAMEL